MGELFTGLGIKTCHRKFKNLEIPIPDDATIRYIVEINEQNQEISDYSTKYIKCIKEK